MEQNFIVTAEHGLHARPAAQLVQVAAPFASAIELVTADKAVNLKSMMSVMGVGLASGASFSVRATGDDAQAAVDAIAARLEEQGLARRA
ncbi:phosphocarrier protein HPr [Deinococcus indicus]|uniref:Phosphocarrier protein HPr n=1 Tax=Deinococcus indicus TaxID=223556 RepID=A0A246BMI5_9DEIO|nr:HPr family phosphocarrier protein [Deinococcus indicus]OWL96871.1 phosphocarrier protein HPr [Deinococcus indicus]GHG38399.1 phosphocarrier protein HPr [Deinococcus indicus]